MRSARARRLEDRARRLLRGGVDKTGRGWLLWWDGGTEREFCSDLDDLENTITRVAEARGLKED